MKHTDCRCGRAETVETFVRRTQAFCFDRL